MLLFLLLRFFYYTAGPNLRHLYKYILHDSPLLVASTQSAVGSNILAINKTLMGDCVAHRLVWATISNELQTAGSFTFNYSANYPSVLSSVAVSSFLPISLKETGRWKPRQKERGWLMQSQQSKLAPTRHITAQVIRLLGAQEPGKKEKERARATVRKTNRIFSPEIHTDRLVAVVRARASGIPVRHPHFPHSRGQMGADGNKGSLSLSLRPCNYKWAAFSNVQPPPRTTTNDYNLSAIHQLAIIAVAVLIVF